MSSRTIQVTQRAFARVGMCLIGASAFMTPPATPADAKPGFHPEVIRGTGTSTSAELQLAYQATFPNGSLTSSVDRLGVGAMQVGDTLIPDSNPTLDKGPGAIILGITRPVDLSPDLVVAQSAWVTGLNFGPGSVSRIRATFIAPVGPIPGGGFAIGLGAKVGGKEDLPDQLRVFTTVNVRPGFLVRLNVPFGAVETTNTVLSQEIKDLIFSTTDPQPFTIELTIDRATGTGQSKLTVGDKVVGPLSFHLSDFLADSGPAITAMGAGPAVNSNGPGQTASVQLRDFRIYTNAGG
jgi:hypothetical protein